MVWYPPEVYTTGEAQGVPLSPGRDGEHSGSAAILPTRIKGRPFIPALDPPRRCELLSRAGAELLRLTVTGPGSTATTSPVPDNHQDIPPRHQQDRNSCHFRPSALLCHGPSCGYHCERFLSLLPPPSWFKKLFAQRDRASSGQITNHGQISSVTSLLPHLQLCSSSPESPGSSAEHRHPPRRGSAAPGDVLAAVPWLLPAPRQCSAPRRQDSRFLPWRLPRGAWSLRFRLTLGFSAAFHPSPVPQLLRFVLLQRFLLGMNYGSSLGWLFFSFHR